MRVPVLTLRVPKLKQFAIMAARRQFPLTQQVLSSSAFAQSIGWANLDRLWDPCRYSEDCLDRVIAHNVTDQAVEKTPENVEHRPFDGYRGGVFRHLTS